MSYDLLVIGDEREGIERAISAAESGDRVAVIRQSELMPRLNIVRNAANQIAEQGELSMDSWRDEVTKLSQWQLLVDDVEFDSLGIEVFNGPAKFVGPKTVEVPGLEDAEILSGREIVLACGTKSRLPAYLQNDEEFVMGVESLLNLTELPRSMIVVGGGQTGLMSAIMLARLGVEVTVVDEHFTLLELCGVFEPTFDALQTLNIAFRLDDEVIGTELRPDLQSAVRLASGKVLVADKVLICVGREGRTEGLDLEKFGVGLDERGRVWCDEEGRSWSDGICAVGDVVGYSGGCRAHSSSASHWSSQREPHFGRGSSRMVTK